MTQISLIKPGWLTTLKFTTVFIAVMVITVACGGGSDWRAGSSSGSSETGSLRVEARTSGDPSDNDGYLVTVDDDSTASIDVDGEVTFTDLSEGDHTVLLSEVANNCQVGGSNPRTVTVSSEDTVATTFQVSCVTSDQTGNLEVTTTTRGENLDPDGYTVLINNGERSEPIGVADTVPFEGLAAGDQTVTLDDVANNCAVANGSRRRVNIIAGETVEETFNVTCSGSMGTLEISTSTTGSGFDDNRYTIEIDGTERGTIDADDEVPLEIELATGDHIVRLIDVDNNCRVAGNNPRTETVLTGETTRTTFQVTCASSSDETGDLRVTATTAGENVNIDNYLIEVNGGAQSQTIGIDSRASLSGLAAGDHNVLLTAVPSSCVLNSDNPVMVTVSEGGDPAIAFAVTCSGRTGDLEVTTGTSGLPANIDTNGYTLLIGDGKQRFSLETDGIITIEDLAEGDHTLQLIDVANNCAVEDGDNPRTVTISDNDTTPERFLLDCFGNAEVGDIEITTETVGDDPDTSGYRAEIDGGTQSTAIGVNESLELEGFAVGPHEIELTDVATNCDVTSNNPQTVNVTVGTQRSSNFEITCSQQRGVLEVSTATADPDGLQDEDYTVVVDGEEPGETIDINDTIVFEGLTEGNHDVELRNVAQSCTITFGGSTQTVNIPIGGKGVTAFSVKCQQ